MGCDCLDLGIIPDDPAQLRAAFLKADREADALITTGGVSVGKRTSPNSCWRSSAKSASGSWPSSRASRLPSVACPTPGSSACRATRSPLWSPSISWCNRRWQAGGPTLRAPASTASHCCRAAQEGAGPARLPARHPDSGAKRPGGAQHRLARLRRVQLVARQLLHRS